MKPQSNPKQASKIMLVCAITDIMMAVVFFAVLSRLRPEMRDVIGIAFLAMALLNFALSYAFKKKADKMTSSQSDE